MATTTKYTVVDGGLLQRPLNADGLGPYVKGLHVLFVQEGDTVIDVTAIALPQGLPLYVVGFVERTSERGYIPYASLSPPPPIAAAAGRAEGLGGAPDAYGDEGQQSFVKQQCLGAIGLLHTQQKKVSGEQMNVQDRADAADAVSFAENYANVARAAELKQDVDALRRQLSKVTASYKENGFADIPLDAAEEPPTGSGGGGGGAFSVTALTRALEKTQQLIGAALVDDGDGSLAMLEKTYEAQQTELLAMISKDVRVNVQKEAWQRPSGARKFVCTRENIIAWRTPVTKTADAYDAAQDDALKAPGGAEAMQRLLKKMESIPGSKVQQKISVELSLGVRRGLPVDVLLARAAKEAESIHQKITATIKRIRTGVKYKAGPLKELPRVLAKIYQKYNGDAAGVTDAVRGAVHCKGYVEMDEAVAEVIQDPEIDILRGKATVDPSHDASNTGGYRDVQLLLYAKGLSLVFEVQFALESMAAVKTAGGHGAYTAARAAGAYSKSVYEYRGELTDKVVAAVASGTLRGVALTRVRDEAYPPGLLSAMLAALASPTCRVTRLGLHGLGLGNDDRERLARGLDARPLFTQLDLGDNECDTAGMQQLAPSIAKQTRLTSLILRQNKLDAAGARLIVDALKSLSQLETLSLASNPFQTGGAAVVAEGLKQLPRLKWLGIAGCNFLSDGIETICAALPSNPRLEFLSLENNDLKAESGPAVANALSHLPNLVWLNLGLNFMKADGIKHVAKVLHLLPNLESLELGANTLKTEGVKLVCEQLHHLPKLKFLNFEQAVSKDEGVEFIAPALKHVPKLQSLNLRGNKFKPGCAVRLAAGLRLLPDLTALDLSRNNFDAAAQAEIVGAVASGCDVTF